MAARRSFFSLLQQNTANITNWELDNIRHITTAGINQLYMRVWPAGSSFSPKTKALTNQNVHKQHLVVSWNVWYHIVVKSIGAGFAPNRCLQIQSNQSLWRKGACSCPVGREGYLFGWVLLPFMERWLKLVKILSKHNDQQVVILLIVLTNHIFSSGFYIRTSILLLHFPILVT